MKYQVGDVVEFCDTENTIKTRAIVSKFLDLSKNFYPYEIIEYLPDNTLGWKFAVAEDELTLVDTCTVETYLLIKRLEA
jgi:hypothetical protein